MQLSKLENEAYEGLKRNSLEIFRIRDICLILNINKTKAYNLIKSLKKKKVIEKLGSGIFSLKGVDEFLVAVNLNWPSYISFWSALNYYGLSDQNPKKIFLVTTKYSKEFKNFKYITLSKNRFFGYTLSGKINIAEKEKAIIDSLLFPKYSGGTKEIEKSIKNGAKELDMEKLIEYAIKVKSKAVLRRLGFILEKLDIQAKNVRKIKKELGKGYELLDPSLRRKNNLNKTWLLDINY